MKVLIDARIDPQSSGGVAQYIEGLHAGLAEVDDASISIGWLVHRDAEGWWTRWLGQQFEAVVVETSNAEKRLYHKAARLARMSGLHRGRLARLAPHPQLPEPREVAAFRPDLVHFPTQWGFDTDRSFVYQPHDFQHEHYPENFTPRQLEARRSTYGMRCRSARRVIVGSEFTAAEVSLFTGVHRSHIDIVPMAPPLVARARPVGPSRETPADFVLYPAAAWPHKNHLRLFEAAGILRDRGLSVHLVLPGASSDALNLRDAARRAGVLDRVHFPGFVSDRELAGLYQRARMVVVPSLFENMSFPIWEAFHFRRPVAASRVCGIPEQVGDAAMLFDPTRSEQIADSIQAIWSNRSLSDALVRRGSRRVQGLSWKKAALATLASYRAAITS